MRVLINVNYLMHMYGALNSRMLLNNSVFLYHGYLFYFECKFETTVISDIISIFKMVL